MTLEELLISLKPATDLIWNEGNADGRFIKNRLAHCMGKTVLAYKTNALDHQVTYCRPNVDGLLDGNVIFHVETDNQMVPAWGNAYTRDRDHHSYEYLWDAATYRARGYTVLDENIHSKGKDKERWPLIGLLRTWSNAYREDRTLETSYGYSRYTVSVWMRPNKGPHYIVHTDAIDHLDHMETQLKKWPSCMSNPDMMSKALGRSAYREYCMKLDYKDSFLLDILEFDAPVYMVEGTHDVLSLSWLTPRNEELCAKAANKLRRNIMKGAV